MSARYAANYDPIPSECPLLRTKTEFKRGLESILANTLVTIEHVTEMIRARYLDGMPGL